MIARPLDRSGLCICGVSVALAFDDKNHKRSCEEAIAIWAAARAVSLSPAAVLGFPLAPSTLDSVANGARA